MSTTFYFVSNIKDEDYPKDLPTDPNLPHTLWTRTNKVNKLLSTWLTRSEAMRELRKVRKNAGNN